MYEGEPKSSSGGLHGGPWYVKVTNGVGQREANVWVPGGYIPDVYQYELNLVSILNRIDGAHRVSFCVSTEVVFE